MSFLTNDSPYENYGVASTWDKYSGARGYINNKVSTQLPENRVRFGVLRVSKAIQKEMRDTTAQMRSGKVMSYYWHDTMKQLIKDSHRIGWLASSGGLSQYDRGQRYKFGTIVSTRFRWFNNFVDKINLNGLDADAVINAGMFGRGMVSLYLNNLYPDIDFRIKQNTVDHFTRVMWSAIKTLYGSRDVFSFESDMLGLIEQQYRRAWNEGLKEAGLDPKTDMTEGMEATLQDSILNELNYIPRFAQEIVSASRSDSGYEMFRGRVDLWANRYNQIAELATRMAADAGQRMIWLLGDTEEHCSTCSALNGLVAFKSEWDTAGLHPQNAPNPSLSCGGWHCDCKLSLTDKRRSPHVLNTLLDIAIINTL